MASTLTPLRRNLGSWGETDEGTPLQGQRDAKTHQRGVLHSVNRMEAILNSRPLVPLDSAPLDGAQVLTLGHFLIGRSLKALPNLPDTTSRLTNLKRWNLCQRLTHNIWDKWSQDYLRQLQQLQRWKHPKRTVRVGDVVLLKDNELFHRSWPLARVEEVHTGSDRLVRVVRLRTERGIYKRAITRLVPLLQEEKSAISPPPPPPPPRRLFGSKTPFHLKIELEYILFPSLFPP